MRHFRLFYHPYSNYIGDAGILPADQHSHCRPSRNDPGFPGHHIYRGADINSAVYRLIFFDQQDILERDRDAFLENRPGGGIVSLDYPLISNLNVWQNIALIRQYHELLPGEAAMKDALESLDRLGLGRIAAMRNPDLREEERFAAMLLRACKIREVELLIDRPFELVPTVHDSSFFDGLLKKIVDLYKACYIFDYRWNKHRYGAGHAEEP